MRTPCMCYLVQFFYFLFNWLMKTFNQVRSLREKLCGCGGIGRRARLKKLSAFVETLRVELVKFGETFQMAIPSEARKGTCRDLTAST